MAVTAKFVPDQIDLLPNTPMTLTLRLYNDDPVTRGVTLASAGDLRDHVRLDTATATLETNQIVDVLVTVFTPATVEAGTYTIGVEVAITPDTDESPPDQLTAATIAAHAAPGDAVAEAAVAETAVAEDAFAEDAVAEPAVAADAVTVAVIATATVDLAAHSDYTIALQPGRSKGATRGRHTVKVANTGNVVITLDMSAEPSNGDIEIGIAHTSLTVAPGSTGELAVSVAPSSTYWSGPTNDHQFVLHAVSTEGRADELTATYTQRPRVPNWVGPAAAGAFAALLLGAVAWFALLRPWVNDTADKAAADAIERDRVALMERIDELEAAAAEAEELPLGSPTDLRLDVAPTGGNTEQTMAIAESGTVLSITDIVLENPTGAVGIVSLQRGDDVILQSELANFRDLDRHFVAPFQFDDTVKIVLQVECRTPGAGASTCPVGASLLGFVDEVD